MPKIGDKKPTALGMHVKAGGFTVGVARAGFRVLGHLEPTSYGVNTARLNWPRLSIRVGESNWNPQEFRDRVDFLYCNPACAPFCNVGRCTTREGWSWRNDERIDYWRQCIDVFYLVRPQVFALESLCTAYTLGKSLVDSITKGMIEKGYSVTYLMVDSKWMEIPQSRRRFFLVAHQTPFLPTLDFSSPPTVGKVLSGVKDPGEYKTQSRIDLESKRKFDLAFRETPEGGKMARTFDKLFGKGEKERCCRNGRVGVPGRPGCLLRRLHRKRQMGAFLGNLYGHPTEDRFLGINEMKALCGYPPDFQIACGLPESAKHLSKAVLPPVAEWLASQVKRSFGRVLKGPPSIRLIDLRKPGIPPKKIEGT